MLYFLTFKQKKNKNWHFLFAKGVIFVRFSNICEAKLCNFVNKQNWEMNSGSFKIYLFYLYSLNKSIMLLYSFDFLQFDIRIAFNLALTFLTPY